MVYGFPNQTPTRFVLKNRDQKDTSYDEIGLLCGQHVITILGLIIFTIGRAYVIRFIKLN